MTDWKNIPDDELDEILRRSAESYTPPFDEAAWKEVSDKLIADRKKIIRTKAFSYLLAGLFLAGVLTFLITNAPAPVFKTDKAANTETPTGKEENNHTKTLNPPLSADKAVIINTPKKENGLKPPFSTDKAAGTNIPAGKTGNSRRSKTLKLPLQNANPVAQGLNNHLKPEDHELRLTERNFPGNDIRSNDESYHTDLKFTGLSIYPLRPKEINRTSPALNLPEIRVSPLKRRSPARLTGFGLRVLYSPDFSTIGTNKIFKAGNNTGILGEYRINNRWSVQTGVMKSLKYYYALPEQYTSPYSLKGLKDINATCDMLDIPLNLRFDFVNTPQHKWFAVAGATSYLMLKEKYTYNYENHYGTSAKKKDWEGKTGFYPFGVINISAGYERRLFKNFTAQAEPFFKVPIQNVGYGNVKLATFGLFISGKIEFPTQPGRNVRRIRF